MLIKSGYGPATQWFDYKPSFKKEQEIIRVEWDLGTMSVVLPADIASYLVANRYARPMTEIELKEYEAPSPLAEEKWPTSKTGGE